MIIMKKALPRRTFLRGVGATLALPLLDAMIPAHTALAATAGNPVRRLGFMYIPMGANIAQWTPKAEGTITYYIIDDKDPVVRNLKAIYPDLFKSITDMPQALRDHIRYPEDFFAIQAQKYATYHMTEPQVFYNKEDLWAIPRRTIEGRDREMEPISHAQER